MAGSPPEKIRNRKTRQVHEGWETDKEYHEDGGEAKGFTEKEMLLPKCSKRKISLLTPPSVFSFELRYCLTVSSVL